MEDGRPRAGKTRTTVPAGELGRVGDVVGREVERLLGPADMGAQLRDSFSFIRDTLSPPS